MQPIPRLNNTEEVTKTNRSRNAIALVVTVLVAIIWWQTSYWYETYLLETQGAQIEQELTNNTQELSAGLYKRISLIEGLAAFIETEMKPTGNYDESSRQRTQSFMSGLFSSMPGLRGFTIAPEGVVEQVYPMEGNSQALGHDLYSDPRPFMQKAIQRALAAKGQITHSQPYELKQGGLGLVARLPVYQEGRVWGIVAVALNVIPVLREAKLIDPESKINIALRSADGVVFFGNPDIFKQTNLVQRVSLPDGDWELAAVSVIKNESMQLQLQTFQTFSAAFLVLLGGLIVAFYQNAHRRVTEHGRATFASDLPGEEIDSIGLTLQDIQQDSHAASLQQRNSQTKHRPPGWLPPALASIAIILASLGFYWFLLGNDTDNRQLELNQDLAGLNSKILHQLNANQAYLEILALELSENRLNAADFIEKGGRYVQDHPGLINVTLADAEFVIQQTTPYEENKQVIGLSLSLPEPKRASRLAKNTAMSVYTKPFVVIQGDFAFEIYVPIFKNGEFFGTLGGVYSLRSLLESMTTSMERDRYSINLLNESGDMLYSTGHQTTNIALAKSIPISPLNNALWLSMSAKNKFFSRQMLMLLFPAALFVFGLSFVLWLQFRESSRYWAINKALQQSQRYFHSIAHGSPMAIIIHDASSGQILYANSRAGELLKVDEDSIAGFCIQDFCISECDYSNIVSQVKQDLRLDDHEIQMINNHEEIFWGAVSSQPATYGTGLALITSVTDLTEKIKYQKRLYRQANHDVLTGLPNRNMAFSRLKQTLKLVEAAGEKAALMLIDLDGFKKINDNFGHSAGDELLKEIAKRLSGTVGKNDTIARLGGDEFTAVLSGWIDLSEVADVANSIIEQCALPVAIGNHEVMVGASIGIAIYPDDGNNHENLMIHADAAMYQGKREGRNTWRFYSEEMSEEIRDRLIMEGELRYALEREQFHLEYQPLFSGRNEKIIGAEALLRWLNPKFNQVPPSVFIPMAESLGLINEIGEWVLQTVCKDITIWQECSYMPEYISINVSGYQLRNDDFIDMIKRNLIDHELPGCVLELEITESALLENNFKNLTIFESLHKLGVRIAIDDFGVGYSSLSYLRQFPFDTLKIDQSFIKDVPHQQAASQLINAIITMTKELGLKIVAEGIENELQLEFLRLLDCDLLQGYFLSIPLKKAEFEAICQSANDASSSLNATEFSINSYMSINGSSENQSQYSLDIAIENTNSSKIHAVDSFEPSQMLEKEITIPVAKENENEAVTEQAS
ncbi:EAL domain-containing protein [Pelagibaculum spongiae]|uniref:Diguanylate cyclase n=1 Tax=Pelagibaculum spongiae TaxID=2080658 RepID=A0A2V1H4Q0_9GAMM|nr:EAL domain-containing protein [Pelagibaculum spongiae]PVZ72198.1 hypothetical protein DC094_04060 [Pelagibaculum spongiae]